MDLEKINQMTDEEFDQLSKEEQQIVIQALEGNVQNTQAMYDQATSEELQSEQIKDIHDDNRAAMLGLGEGLSLGYGDEITSAAIATAQTIENTKKQLAEQGMAGFDNFLPTWKENYNKVHSAFDRGIKELKEKNPNAFAAGQVLGTLGSGSLVGGIAPQVTKSLVGRLSLAGAEGFIHGSGISNAETIGGRFQAGLEGAESTASAAGIIEGVTKTGGAVVGFAKDKVAPTALIEFLSDETKTFNKMFNVRKKEDHAKFFERMSDYVDKDGEYILKSWDNTETALQSVHKSLLDTGEDLGKIVSSIEETGILQKSDVNGLISTLNRKVIDEIPADEARISSKKLLKLKNKLKQKLDEEFFIDDPSGATIKMSKPAMGVDVGQEPIEVPKRILKDWNLSDLVSYKNQISDEIGEIIVEKGKVSQEAYHLKRIRDEVHHFVDKQVKRVSHKLGGENAELYDLYRNSAQKYRDLVNVDKLLLDRVENSTGVKTFNKLFRDSWGKMTIGAATAGYAFGVEPSTAGTTIGALAILASNPRVNKAFTLGLHRIVDAAKKNPGKYARRLETIAVASDVSSQEFYENVLTLGAEVDLGEQPLNRTNGDLIARKDSLLTVANDINPELRDTLEEAFRSENTDVVAKLILETPELNKFLMPGLGWNGKAVTEQDKAAVQSYISKLKPRAKRDATLDFNQNMTIPTGMLTNEPPSIEQVFKHKRIKDKVKKPRI